MARQMIGKAYSISKEEYYKNCPIIQTEINWYDLPCNKLLQLNKNFQKNFMSFWEKIPYGYKKQKAYSIGLSTAQINCLFRLASNFTVYSLKKIADLQGIQYNDITKHIKNFGRRRVIKHPTFPFAMSSHEGVALRSIISSEGHISNQIGRSVMVRVPEIPMLRKVIKSSQNLFGNFSAEIKKTDKKKTHEIYLPGEIGDVLVMSGLTRGRKSTKNPFIPRDIMNSTLDKKRTYLQWSFAGEMECSHGVIKLTRNVNVSNFLPEEYKRSLTLGANFKKRLPIEILDELVKHPPWLLVGESLLLQDFGIYRKPYLRSLWKHKNGEVSAAWAVTITGKKNISALLYGIGLPLAEKRIKVEEALFLH